jgi:hypothetical protein
MREEGRRREEGHEDEGGGGESNFTHKERQQP